MTILVTGANGFLGSALCKKLHEDGFKVRGVSRAIGQCADGIEHTALAEISSKTDWTNALKNVKQVVHLAAQMPSIGESNPNLLLNYQEININGTVNLANQAAALGIKRFIFLSTIKVNGEFVGKGHQFRSDDAPNPGDLYAVSKFEAEQLLWKIAAQTGMEVVILRPPLVYGPGVKGNFFALLRAIDRRLPLPFGGIKNQRSLIYLGNLIDLIAHCIEYPQASGKTLLVSDGDDVSTPELIRRIGIALNRKPFLISVSTRWLYWMTNLIGKTASIDRMTGSLCLDSALAQKEIDWAPPFTMQEGLLATAQWYRKIHSRKQ